MKLSSYLIENISGPWFIERSFAIGEVSSILSSVIQFIELKEREAWIPKCSNGFEVFSASGYKEDQKLYDQVPKGSIAIIPFSGVLMKNGTEYNWGALEIAEKIIIAANHKNISAILYHGDGPGGAVNAIPIISEATIYAKSKKPVLLNADLCASAFYWVASDTNHIMAQNSISSRFGSIGVMTSLTDFSGLLEKIGIVTTDIYGPESDFKNEEYREFKDNGTTEKLKANLLSPLELKFKNHVKAARMGKLNEKTPGVISGKMFFAEEAKNAGLIDSIGNMQKAVEKAMELVEIRKFMQTK